MTGWWAAAFVVQWILLVVVAVVVVALARQVGTLHLRLGPRGALELDDEGPALGEAPAPVAAQLYDGGRAPIGGPGPLRLVMFASPTCPICLDVLPAIPAAATAAGAVPQIVHDTEAEGAWSVPGTPFFVVLDRLGVARAKGTADTLEQVEGLLDTARDRMEETRWAS
ncbi:MAG TPA: hypothetical protein VH989_07985 [Actinomycetota bacterium]|jgi:hypothetical protein